MSKFLNKNQLKKIGFFKIGKGCKISNKISCYNLKGSLGDNVRIDDYVCLKGKVSLKSNIHIARGCTLSGGNKGIFVTATLIYLIMCKSSQCQMTTHAIYSWWSIK